MTCGSMSVSGVAEVQVSALKREQQGWTSCCFGTEIRCTPLSRGMLSHLSAQAIPACNNLHAARHLHNMLRMFLAWQVTSGWSIQ